MTYTTLDGNIKNISNGDLVLDNHIGEGYYNLNDHNDSFLFLKSPIEVMDELKSPIYHLKNNFQEGIRYQDSLAGQINHEYKLDLTLKFSSFIQNAYHKYTIFSEDTQINKFNSKFRDGNNPKFNLDHLWINFQQKHEFNPIHKHSGVFSFVLWYDIPFLYEEEGKLGPGSFTDPTKPSLNSCFSFIGNSSTESLSQIPLPIDKRYNGYLAFFPSHLHHIVYPFYTSDEYRITVAGNIYLS